MAKTAIRHHLETGEYSPSPNGIRDKMNTLRLPSLKASQLKYLAFLTGVSSSGTKATIEYTLLRSLNQSSKLATQDGKDSEAYGKVISIDMGIRNLAYCEVQFPLRNNILDLPSSPALRVTQWERLDLLDPHSPNGTATEDKSTDSERTVTKRTKSKIKSAIDKDAFTPPRLAKTAHTIIDQVLAQDPDVILIERQRFRSGGAAAIQEWTVRVNMLESMLWACLETHQDYYHSQRFPEAHAISPRRVADFWVPGNPKVSRAVPQNLFQSGGVFETGEKDSASARKKVEKKDKVGVVKSWILDASSDVDIEFTTNDAAAIADAFSKEKSGGRVLAGGKLDDLADCLLQAVAYVRWEENKRAIREMLDGAG